MARGAVAAVARGGQASRIARIRGKIKSYIDAWRSILLLARRPDDEEFSLLLKLSILGFTLVGGIGYIIHLLYVLLTS